MRIVDKLNELYEIIPRYYNKLNKLFNVFTSIAAIRYMFYEY